MQGSLPLSGQRSDASLKDTDVMAQSNEKRHFMRMQPARRPPNARRYIENLAAAGRHRFSSKPSRGMPKSRVLIAWKRLSA